MKSVANKARLVILWDHATNMCVGSFGDMVKPMTCFRNVGFIVMLWLVFFQTHLNMCSTLLKHLSPPNFKINICPTVHYTISNLVLSITIVFQCLAGRAFSGGPTGLARGLAPIGRRRTSPMEPHARGLALAKLAISTGQPHLSH
jgi:hypothetical protein